MRFQILFLLSLAFVDEALSQTQVSVSPVPGAQALWVHADLEDTGVSEADLIRAWAVQRADQTTESQMIVPVQTGRALLAIEKFNLQGDVLAKGTGLNNDPQSLESVARIRFEPTTREATPGDGFFTIREAFVDQVTSELLADQGVLVPRPLAIFSTGKSHPQYGAGLGVYVREFINQTRLSNLDAMSPEDARAALDEAAERLYRSGRTAKKMDRVELYFYLMQRMARSVASLQAVGYQHNYLHWQQVTLAGELADLGTGTWVGSQTPRTYDVPRSLSYMEFENQPVIVQNMFVRSHSITAEGGPQPLAKDSDTRLQQKNSLLGVYRRIDPQAAARIERLEPEKLFWDFFRIAKGSMSERPVLEHRASQDFFSSSVEDFLVQTGVQVSDDDRHRLEQEFDATKKAWGVRALPHDYIRKNLVGSRGSAVPSCLQRTKRLASSAPVGIRFHPRIP